MDKSSSTNSSPGSSTRNAATAGPKVAKASVGTAVAAATLAAVAVLSGPGLAGGTSTVMDPASIIASPPNSQSSRIAGVHEDLARAVALQQVTPEQASFLENQLVRRIKDGSESA